MRLFHELVWDGYLSGTAPVYGGREREDLLGSADQLSLSGYCAGVAGTNPTLTVQVEQSYDHVRWINRNASPEVNALPLSTTAETTFSGCDGDPSFRSSAAFARLRIALNGTNPTGRVRIWATGRDPEGDTTPLSVLGPSSVLQWCRSDLGITLNGSTVSKWADQSGRGNDYVQNTAGKQPTFGGGPSSSTRALYFDGIDDEMVASSFNLPAPGTTPTYIWLVVSQSSWTTLDGLFSADQPLDSNFYLSVVQIGSSPNLRQTNGSGTFQDNGGLPTLTFGRVEAGFTNSTADFIKCVSTLVTGTNTGNFGAGTTGRTLARTQTTHFGNFGIAEILYANRIPSDAERAALDAYCTSRYGAGLV